MVTHRRFNLTTLTCSILLFFFKNIKLVLSLSFGLGLANMFVHTPSPDSLTALTRTLNFLVIYLIVHENTGLEGVFFVAVRAPINLDL